MKAPVGLLSDGAVLRSKMEGLCPDKFRHDAQNADNARKNTAFPPVCKKCAKVCRAPENGKSHEESYDSSWDFGALEGTRIPGPLIKRAGMAHISIHGSCVISPFYDESPRFSIVWFVHPLSDFATEIHLCILCDRAKTVQKPCTYSRTN